MRHIMWPNVEGDEAHAVPPEPNRLFDAANIIYLCTILGLGHSYQELEDRLGLGHQRGDSMDDRCKLGIWFNTYKKVKGSLMQFSNSRKQLIQLSNIRGLIGSLKRRNPECK